MPLIFFRTYTAVPEIFLRTQGLNRINNNNIFLRTYPAVPLIIFFRTYSYPAVPLSGFTLTLLCP